MAVGPYPFLDPVTGRLQSLAGRPSLDPRCPLPLFVPIEFKAQKGEPTFPARMETTETQQTGLLRGPPLGRISPTASVTPDRTALRPLGSETHKPSLG